MNHSDILLHPANSICNAFSSFLRSYKSILQAVNIAILGHFLCSLQNSAVLDLVQHGIPSREASTRSDSGQT